RKCERRPPRGVQMQQKENIVGSHCRSARLWVESKPVSAASRARSIPHVRPSRSHPFWRNQAALDCDRGSTEVGQTQAARVEDGRARGVAFSIPGRRQSLELFREISPSSVRRLPVRRVPAKGVWFGLAPSTSELARGLGRGLENIIYGTRQNRSPPKSHR